MSAPPSLKQVDTSQMDDAPEWFREAFLSQLNPFLRSVVALFTRGITTGDNILAEEREISFATGASVAADTKPFPLFVTPQIVKHPRNVIVTNNAVDGVAPVGAVQPVWSRTADGRIKLFFTGLDANTAYKIRLRID